MKSTCTKYLSSLCLILFSVQVIFLYGNSYEKSNPTFASILTESRNDGCNPFESSSDNPEQEEQEESQESEESEEGNELEVLSDDLYGQQSDFQFSELNYYYLLKSSDGINNEQYYPPEYKI